MYVGRDRSSAVAGKTFPAFPVCNLKFYVSGKRPIVKTSSATMGSRVGIMKNLWFQFNPTDSHLPLYTCRSLKSPLHPRHANHIHLLKDETSCWVFIYNYWILIISKIRGFCTRNIPIILVRPPGSWAKTFPNTLRPRQNGRHFAEDIFKYIFLNENVIISAKISLTFVPNGPFNNIPALVKIMAWHRPGDNPLSEPTMVRLHICVTRPQWANGG